MSKTSQTATQPARSTVELVQQWKEAGEPIVLAICGKIELVVQDEASFGLLRNLRVDRARLPNSSCQMVSRAVRQNRDAADPPKTLPAGARRSLSPDPLDDEENGNEP